MVYDFIKLLKLQKIIILPSAIPSPQISDSLSHSQHVRLSGSVGFAKLFILYPRFRKLRDRNKPALVESVENHSGKQWQVASPSYASTDPVI